MFEQLSLPVIKKTPKGAPSTAEPVLQELAQDYELPKVILDYRSFSKLKSTYTDKLPELIDSNTGRIHTSYHQAVAATGRLSSSDPNLQNIPIRTAEGRKIRQAFIAPSGFKLVAADYSQIELRIMAHLSEDEGLISAFNHVFNNLHQQIDTNYNNIFFMINIVFRYQKGPRLHKVIHVLQMLIFRKKIQNSVHFTSLQYFKELMVTE